MKRVKSLSPREELFCQEYMICSNAAAAYRKIYAQESLSNAVCSYRAAQLKNKPHIQEKIQELRKALAKDAHMRALEVLELWMKLATYDANDIVQVRRIACHKCIKDNEENIPNKDCGYCKGEGEEKVYVQDTRYLSDNAKLAYLGAKQTKYGAEVQLVDRMQMLKNIAQHLGMLHEKIDLIKQEDKESYKLETNDPMECMQIYQRLMR